MFGINITQKTIRHASYSVLFYVISVSLMGCPAPRNNSPIPNNPMDPQNPQSFDNPIIPPPPVNPSLPSSYEVGFDAGFSNDGYYWAGFFDGLDTVDGGTLYYRAEQIPYVESPPYEAGYYDGLWYAYNDGYFVQYDYAFTIGFSEGYDVFYSNAWQTLLNQDEHIEWLDGGFTDGYHDGFSEGRIFGAYDYVNNIPFDWFDAMLDYRSGIDLEMGGEYTGENGPVSLYEWGTDPKTLTSEKKIRWLSHFGNRTIRKSMNKSIPEKSPPSGFEPPNISYRPLVKEAIEFYSYRPSSSPRFTSIPLRLQTTWLERIRTYRQMLVEK